MSLTFVFSFFLYIHLLLLLTTKQQTVAPGQDPGSLAEQFPITSWFTTTSSISSSLSSSLSSSDSSSPPSGSVSSPEESSFPALSVDDNRMNAINTGQFTLPRQSSPILTSITPSSYGIAVSCDPSTIPSSYYTQPENIHNSVAGGDPVDANNHSHVVNNDHNEEHKEVRRVKQNIASKAYRKRQRDRLGELEDTVAALTKQLEDAKLEVSKLKQSPMNCIVNVDFKSTADEGRNILQSIEGAMKDNSSDAHLQYLLHLFWSNMEILLMLFDKEAPKFSNPYLQMKRAMYGYGLVTKDTTMMRLIPAAPWWRTFSTNELGLTEHILAQIDNILFSFLPFLYSIITI
eukprot:TRINITY_DN12005_c0_g2_i2.p1 TRINITY_DN12005_c0_g2~~TRINITY_DN12005_c0_g2_i2.p1  ORF type:complete len:346 (+),score=93.68 TRINITY_DN12005_c0_g2_i2:142-1179(+)